MKDLNVSLDQLLASGMAVVSGDKSVIRSTVQKAIASGQTATFYVPRDQALSIFRWYWTPKLVAETGLKAVSKEEIARIEKELDVQVVGQCFSNTLVCPNGHPYGAYEFIKQGVSEHGPEFVKGAVEATGTSIIRVNPSGWEICPTCDAMIVSGGHYYSLGGGRYGCCRGSSGFGTVMSI